MGLSNQLLKIKDLIHSRKPEHLEVLRWLELEEVACKTIRINRIIVTKAIKEELLSILLIKEGIIKAKTMATRIRITFLEIKI